jgi:hypothetical protein
LADIGYVRSQVNAIQDAATRRILTNVFEHILGNIRFGEPQHMRRAENLQAYFYASTTASDTATIISIAHGLGVTPNLAIPIIDVRQVGAKLPALEVARAADNQRVYFKAEAGSTSAAFKLLIE